jgi:hypothetical protein
MRRTDEYWRCVLVHRQFSMTRICQETFSHRIVFISSIRQLLPMTNYRYEKLTFDICSIIDSQGIHRKWTRLSCSITRFNIENYSTINHDIESVSYFIIVFMMCHRLVTQFDLVLYMFIYSMNSSNFIDDSFVFLAIMPSSKIEHRPMTTLDKRVHDHNRRVDHRLGAIFLRLTPLLKTIVQVYCYEYARLRFLFRQHK